MEIGCCISSGNIGKLPECGFDFVELPGKELFRMEPGQITALRRRLDKRNLRCKSLNAYCPENIIIAGPGQNLGEARAYARKIAGSMDKDQIIVINLSGRGDKDVAAIARYRGVELYE